MSVSTLETLNYSIITSGSAMILKGESCLNMDLMKMIIPVFTMSLGYMFGKNDTRDS